MIRCHAVLGALATLLLLAPAGAHAQANKPLATLVMVVDGPGAFEDLRETLQTEIIQVLSSGREVRFLPALEGDFSPEGARKQLDTALANPQVDAVIGLGLYVTAAVAARDTLPKPVVLPRVAPRLQGLPLSDGTSGRKNLTYVGGLMTFERDLRRLKDILPFEHAALLVDSRTVEALPAVETAVREASDVVGVQTTLVPTATDVAAILAATPSDARVVYLTDLPQLSAAQRKQLIEALAERKQVVFSMSSPSDVSLGAFASLVNPKEDLRRSRRTALLLERILNGAAAATLSVTYEPKEELTLNRNAARHLGVTPRPEILVEAKLEGTETAADHGVALDLRRAVRRAMASNLDVGVNEQALAASEQGVKRARGTWLPQLDARAGFKWVDPDGASAFGPAERTLSWGLQGQQVLYSRDRFADLGTQKQRQAGSAADLTTTRLDAGVSAARAYLNVLRARIIQQINEENLEQTLQNLHLAEARVAAGAAGRDEVFRWQAEVAKRRSDVLNAIATARGALVVLNRYLNEPLETPWSFQEVAIADIVLMLPGREDFLATLEGREATIDFMVQRAMEQSPELKSLDASIEGQRIVLKASQQSFYAPSVSAVGGFNHQPGTWGKGSDTRSTAGVPVPARDDFSWNVGVQAELPLFAGNSRTAGVREQSRELSRLETSRAASAQRIEQGVRTRFIRLGGSYPAVELARQAAAAAERNLEVITDKYRRGATDIIRLIDAQNQALLSHLGEASAVYDFLTDYVNAERSTGSLMFILDDADRQKILEELATFAHKGQ